jgi:hypothetical protein
MTQSISPQPNRFWRDFALIAALTGGVFLLYGPSLAYPFVWHEADDLSRTLRYTPLQYLTGMPSYEYYRPLVFFFWRSILDAWGAASAPIFHAYSIAMHLLNSVLLYAFVRAVSNRRTLAAAAALLFVTFPFSYQAITWSTADFHPMVLLFTLITLLIYVRTRLREAAGQRGWRLSAAYGAAALSFVIAIWVHETGFVTIALIFLVEIYLVITRRVPRWSWWPLLYVGVTAAMLVIYILSAKSPPLEKTFQVNSALYLLQGLIYPSAQALTRVCLIAGCDSVAWLVPVLISTLLVMGWAWWSGKTWPLGLLGALWFVIGVAPAWAGRDYTYLSFAPRLLYFSSAGAALALAAIIGLPHMQWRALRFGVLALVLIVSTQFVIARQALYDTALRLVAQENAAMFGPREGKAIFINAVDLFAFGEPEFPLGWTGVPVAPWHNRLGVTPHLRNEKEADWVIDPAQTQPLQDQSQLALEFHGRVVSPEEMQSAVQTARDVFQVKTIGPEFHQFQIAHIDHDMPQPDQSTATWTTLPLRLVAAQIEQEAGVPVLNLDWWIGGPIDPNQTVFVHVLDANGQLVAQADDEPIGGYAPFNLWPPGTRVNERRPLLALSDLAAGDYTVVVGLYDRNSLQRTVPQPGAAVTPDGAVLAGQIKR